MNLHQAQSEIASDKHRFRVVDCGRRFGKTTLAVYEMIAKAVAKDNVKIAYIAPTYQQARDIAWQELKKIVKPITIGNANESRLEINLKTVVGGSSQILLRGWESIENLRGQKFDFLVLDEVASYRNFWIGWQEVLRPTLTDVRGDALFISTPKGYNHFFDLYNLEKEDKSFKSFHFTSYDNPHIPKEEIDEAKTQLTEDRFAQEYMADFRKTEGLVYKEFDRTRHLFDNKTILPQMGHIIVGVDFGYTNPACILKIGIDGDSHYWIMEEWYKTQQTTAQIIEKAKQYHSDRCYPDPAEPDRIAEMMKAGLNCREVSKDIVNGIDTVRELFKQNRIMIHKDCRNLIWELETYRYPDKKPDNNENEKPIKENDHAVDALRYALYSDQPVVEEEDFNYNLYSEDYG